MSSVKVGNAEIISFLDVGFAFPYSGAFPAVPAEKWEPYKSIYPRCWNEQGNWATNSQAFLVRSAGQTLLVDTGLGPGPHQDQGGARGNLLGDMRSKGVSPEDVDMVILTHLHFDHSGWALHEGKPLCPRARYLVPEADWPMLGRSDLAFAPASAYEPLREMGKLEFTSGEKSVTPEVTLIPTPGHSPGHQSIVIASAGERAIILGDLFNHPAQLDETGWNAGFDAEPDRAVATRSRMFDRLEQEPTIVASGHYPHPGFGRIVRESGRRIFRAL